MKLQEYEALDFIDMKEAVKNIPTEELKLLVNQINKGFCKKREEYQCNCIKCMIILLESRERKMFYFPCPFCPDRARAETLFEDELIVKNGDVACISCWKKLDADAFKKNYHCVEVLYHTLFEDKEDFWKDLEIDQKILVT